MGSLFQWISFARRYHKGKKIREMPKKKLGTDSNFLFSQFTKKIKQTFNRS